LAFINKEREFSKFIREFFIWADSNNASEIFFDSGQKDGVYIGFGGFFFDFEAFIFTALDDFFLVFFRIDMVDFTGSEYFIKVFIDFI
jgi:hypothetical protein